MILLLYVLVVAFNMPLLQLWRMEQDPRSLAKKKGWSAALALLCFVVEVLHRAMNEIGHARCLQKPTNVKNGPLFDLSHVAV